MTNGYDTAATITPQPRTDVTSAPSYTSRTSAPRAGPEATTRPKLKLDARLETIRQTIESQPTAIQSTLSDTAVAMLLVTRKLREKRAGIVNLTTNKDLYPRSCNLKIKLNFPDDMKDDAQTQENAKKWDELIQKVKDEMKKQLVNQGERTVEFMQEKRLDLFHERLLTIAEGYFTWFSALDGIDAPETLSNHAYGAASIYCFYNEIAPRHGIFNYLGETQDGLLEGFKSKHLTTASGRPLFSDRKLQTLTTGIIIDDGPPATPIQLNPYADTTAGVNITQPTLGQPTGTPADPVALDTPTPPALSNVCFKVKEKIYDLVPILFVNLVHQVEASQRELTANTKLEAALKSKKTLDMAKLLDADMGAQGVVAPENMKDLVHTLVDRRLSLQAKQTARTATQAARKKSSGGANTARTPPSKHKNGERQRGQLKRPINASTPPVTKRAKKQATNTPDQAYQALERRRRTQNPYAQRHQSRPPTSSPSGRGYSPGRGRGRNQGRGDSNRGRGRGRGRSSPRT
jgi:hypothetical protein